MNTLNKKIRDLRKRKGLTQEQMAKRLGITQSGYQQIETGNSDSMRVKTLRDFCKAFGVSADELLDLEPYREEPGEPETAED